MPLPIIVVPPYPDVPNLPGVPPLLRSPNAATSTILGPITGAVNSAGRFTGQITVALRPSSGPAVPYTGTLSGALDNANNFSGTLGGALGGNVIGQITGTIDRVQGVIRGVVSGVVTQLTGALSALGISVPALNALLQLFRWGIFTSGGQPALLGDNVVGVDYRREFQNAAFPLEAGKFATYNKVERPFDLQMTFTVGGNAAHRKKFLTAAENLVASLDLYTAVVPEWSYTRVNPVHMNVPRSQRAGSGLLTVEMGLQLVRSASDAAFTDSKADVNAGPVQPTDPTPPQVPPIDTWLEGPPGLPVVG